MCVHVSINHFLFFLLSLTCSWLGMLTHSLTHGLSNQCKGDSFHAAARRGGKTSQIDGAPHLRCHLVTKLRQEGLCNSGNDAAVVCGVCVRRVRVSTLDVPVWVCYRHHL